MFNEFFFQIKDYLVYCKTKGLSEKTIKSYEQSLRLFARYCEEQHKIEMAQKVTKKVIVEHLAYARDRGKYTVVAEEISRKSNKPQGRTDLGKRVTVTTINNYLRNIKAINIQDNIRSNVNYGETDSILPIWSVKNPGFTTLYTHNEDGSELSLQNFMMVAAHEFGHNLGLGDAYGEKGRRKDAPLDKVPENDLMGSGSVDAKVSNIDILMLLDAWTKNKFQNFRRNNMFIRKINYFLFFLIFSIFFCIYRMHKSVWDGKFLLM